MEVVAKERRPGGVKFPEIAHLVSGARGKTVYEDGDSDAGIWSASPVMALVDEILPCQVLLDRMVAEAEEVLLKGATYVKRPSKL